MTYYRVVGALRAAYAVDDDEVDLVDLNLIVPATHPVTAEYAAKLIAVPDYNYTRWVGTPTIEKVSDE